MKVFKMKKIYLVHCWEGSCEDGWYPWLDKKLKGNNIEFIRLNMPNTSHPTIKEWVKTLDDKVSKLDENTYFIGHSIGCQTIMRYLQSKEITPIGGILFVAPWLNLLPKALEDEESIEIAKPWLETSIDFEKVKKFTNNINCIFSDDDYFVPITEEKEFKNKLNSNNLIVSEKGHISQEDDVYELKEILDMTYQMLNKGDEK